MPHFTDTHTHPYVPEFDADRAEVMQRALDAGVTRMIMPNISVDSVAAMRALAAQWPDNTRMAMGLHPEEFDATNWQARLQDVLDELRRHSSDYIAVGEIGIDLYWDATYEREQMIVFEQQLQLGRVNAGRAILVEIDIDILSIVGGKDDARAVQEILSRMLTLRRRQCGIADNAGQNLKLTVLYAVEVSSMARKQEALLGRKPRNAALPYGVFLLLPNGFRRSLPVCRTHRYGAWGKKLVDGHDIKDKIVLVVRQHQDVLCRHVGEWLSQQPLRSAGHGKLKQKDEQNQTRHRREEANEIFRTTWQPHSP